MANLNLSEFGEKLFVADADHTFIWDTMNLISKRVSRNSWLNSGTLTSDAPVTISQTWNALAVAFTALKVNATSTNSAAASKLLDLQVGTVTQLSVSKSGTLNVNNVSSLSNFVALTLTGKGGSSLLFDTGIIYSNSTLVLDTASANLQFNRDTILLRDGADNTLALRNGAAAQTFNVYGTWTTAITNFERLAIKYNTTDLAYQIAAEKGTTNGDYRPLQLWTGGASRLHVSTAGNVGIGTTAPGAKLEVAGNILVNGATQIIDDGNILSVKGSTTNAFKAGYVVVTSGDNAVTTYQGAVLSGGFFGTFTNHKCFIRTNNVERVTIDTAGNLGIGTTSPSSKLQVSAGDVEVDTIAKGVILKSPDGTRYRVTVANGGTLSVAAV